MSVTTRLLAAGFAATVSLGAVVTLAQLPVHADPIRIAAVANATQTSAAADYLAAQWEASPATFTKGGLADSILALAAAQSHQGAALAMLEKLEGEASAYATNPAAAGKLALVAAVMDVDARDFGGVDLIAVISEGVAADPTAGGFFGPSLAILGLARNGVPVPAALLEAALATQGASGAFGYVETWNDNTFVEDADSTGMMIAALAALPPSDEVDQALTKAIAWAQSARTAGGYWSSYSPVNSTGLLGSALEDEGVDVSASVAWMSGQQLADGGLPAKLDGTTSNGMATTQGILLLAETGYATLQFVPAQAGGTASATSSASSTASATSSASATASATSTSSASSSATVTSSAPVTVSGSPSSTFTGPFGLPSVGHDDSGLGVGVLVLAAGAAGALALRRR